MGFGLCLFKEYWWKFSGGNGGISKIRYRDFVDEDREIFGEIFNDYWIEVHGEDLRKILIVDTPEIGEIETNGIRAKIAQYIYEGCKIRLAIKNEKIIGFMLYHLVFDCVVVSRGFYVIPEERGRTRIMGLVFSLGNIKRVISQTYKNNGPKELYKETKTRRKIHEDKDLITWENILNRRRN